MRRLIVCLLASGIVAAAQSDTVTPSREQKEAQIGSHLLDPTLDSPARFAATQLLLKGSVEKQTAAASLGLTNGDSYLNFKAEATLKESAESVNILSLTGFQKGTTGSISAGHIWWNPRGDKVVQTQVCTEYFMSQGKTREEARNAVCTLNTLPNKSDAKRFPEATSDSERSQICKEHYLALGTPPTEIAEQKCSAEILSRSSYRQRYNNAIAWGKAHLVNIEGSLNGAKYDYAQTSTLAVAKESHTNYKGTASYGVLWGVSTFLRGSYTYGSEYEDKDEDPADICTPRSDVAGSLECRKLSVGVPQRSITSAISAELNYEILPRKLGITPGYSYDVRESDHGIKFPINFLRSDAGLLGGVELSWSSKKHQFVAALFIGHVRSLFTKQ